LEAGHAHLLLFHRDGLLALIMKNRRVQYEERYLLGVRFRDGLSYFAMFKSSLGFFNFS